MDRKGGKEGNGQRAKADNYVSWKLTCFLVERKKLKVKVREGD